MKTKQKIRYWWWAAAVLLLVGIAAVLWFLVPGFRKGLTGDVPVSSPAPTYVAEYYPTDVWRTSTPEEQGFDSVILAQGLQSLQNQNLDSLLIIRNGYVILDATFFPYDGIFFHDLASVTKSVTTTLIGIAAGQGKLQLDQPMVSYFPDRTIANLDDRKQNITVRNLAGMVNGMQSGCLAADDPTLTAMRSQPDWIQAALDRPMLNPPGKVFCYDSPGMHILSAILSQTTGMTEQEFAQQYLFDPLDIKDFYWEIDPQGYNHGWVDLWLKPQDAARIGYLFLHHGAWDGQQIVPQDWVSEAVKSHVGTGQGSDYGYGWWVSDDSYYAMGRGGQNIKVYPAFNIIVVTTGSYFSYATLDPILEEAFVDPNNLLPANPDGMAQLESVLSEIKQGQGLQPASYLPEIANIISGKTYQCSPNKDGINSFRFEFNDLQVMKLFMEQNGQKVEWNVGLDGNYRLSPDGLIRGYWASDSKFILQQFDIGTRIREINFDKEQLELIIPEMNMTLKCQMQHP
jgi:CubicO group peptidase (beta-lactamase class C family)